MTSENQSLHHLVPMVRCITAHFHRKMLGQYIKFGLDIEQTQIRTDSNDFCRSSIDGERIVKSGNLHGNKVTGLQ